MLSKEFKIDFVVARQMVHAIDHWIDFTKHLDKTSVSQLNTGDLYLTRCELKEWSDTIHNDLERIMKEHNIPEASEKELNELLFGKDRK